jgi:hypothetical protein
MHFIYKWRKKCRFRTWLLYSSIRAAFQASIRPVSFAVFVSLLLRLLLSPCWP